MPEPTRPTIESEGGVSPEVRSYLQERPIGNAWAVHDLTQEPGQTRFWWVRDRGKPAAYLALTETPEFNVSWAHLSGEAGGARTLISHLPRERVVVIAPRDVVPDVLQHVGGGRLFPEDVMAVERGSEMLAAPGTEQVIGPEFADEYQRLVTPSVLPRTPASLERSRRHLHDEVVYGVVADGALVSVAGTSVRTSDAWIVGGVVTVPEHRRHGYARSTVSAVTREALAHVGRAGLWVGSENLPAIALYQRLGYRKIDETMWIDVGTGLDP